MDNSASGTRCREGGNYFGEVGSGLTEPVIPFPTDVGLLGGPTIQEDLLQGTVLQVEVAGIVHLGERPPSVEGWTETIYQAALYDE